MAYVLNMDGVGANMECFAYIVCDVEESPRLQPTATRKDTEVEGGRGSTDRPGPVD